MTEYIYIHQQENLEQIDNSTQPRIKKDSKNREAKGKRVLSIAARFLIRHLIKLRRVCF